MEKGTLNEGAIIADVYASGDLKISITPENGGSLVQIAWSDQVSDMFRARLIAEKLKFRLELDRGGWAAKFFLPDAPPMAEWTLRKLFPETTGHVTNWWCQIVNTAAFVRPLHEICFRCPGPDRRRFVDIFCFAEFGIEPAAYAKALEGIAVADQLTVLPGDVIRVELTETAAKPHNFIATLEALARCSPTPLRAA